MDVTDRPEVQHPRAGPHPARAVRKPSSDEVLQLFVRDGEHDPPKSTVLFAYVAQWFTDGFLRSDRSVVDPRTGKIKEPRDITRNESTHEVDLAQLYGLTAVDTAMLRASEERALLDYQLINGEAYPRDMFDEHGSRLPRYEHLRMVGPGKEHVDPGELLAMGSDAANTQIGYAMVNTLFLREHNRIAREIRKADQSR